MQFVCDVHISYKIKNHLLNRGHQCLHVNEILAGDRSTDNSIAAFCNQNSCILITKDQDFADSHLLKRLPARLLKISLGNISTSELIKLIDAAIPLLEEISEKHHFMMEIHKHSIQISYN